MNFVNTIGIKSVLKGIHIDDRYKVGFLRKDWPFTPAMKVVTKAKGNPFIPIGLDHDAHEYTYVYGDITLRGKNPYQILTQMALKGIMPISKAAMNWSALWTTVDDGRTWVLAKDLNHANCTEHGVALREDIHHCVPSDS
jgi:hypothetical protein